MSADPRSARVVLVTGASGFLGGHVSAGLLAAGHRVRALVRHPGQAPVGTEAVCGTLDDAAALEAACAGAQWVVHLAGRAHVAGETEREALAAFRRVNAEGTRRLARAAAGAGAGTFLLMSSVAAVAGSSQVPLHEGAPARPVTPYGVSKREAEESLAAEGGAMRAVVVRPPLVFGAGMKGNPLRLFALVQAGVPVPVPLPPNRRSVLYVGNLVEAVLALLGHAAARGPFFVADAVLSTAELVAGVARALGRPARTLPVPAGLLRAAGRAGEALAPLLRPPLTAAAAEGLAGSLVLDTSHLRDCVNYRPRWSLAEALEATAAWYRAEARAA